MVLLNFHPNSEVEISIFFAARTVFFLMLVIDYIQVAYYNYGIERFIGLLGVIVSIVFALIDLSGFMNFLVLEKANSGYIISGNGNNFITSFIKPFNAQTYIFISALGIIFMLGIEVINSGVRGERTIKQSTKEGKTTETA